MELSKPNIAGILLILIVAFLVVGQTLSLRESSTARGHSGQNSWLND